MKKILGLDLGTNSIGWALVEQDFEQKKGEILGLGSRVIPMPQDEIDAFGKGVSISQTAERTRLRSTRRLRERHLLRRERLHRVLHALGFLPKHYAEKIDFEQRVGQFLPETETKLVYNDQGHFIFQRSFGEMLADFAQHQPALVADGRKIPYDWTIYYLRKKALTEKIENEELAWLLLHFNQKRGYYQLRGEDEDEKPNKTEEFHSLKVVDVVADELQKGKQEVWYNVILENGWIYRRASKVPLFEWKNLTRDFIVSTDVNEDGTVKKDKDGKEKRSFRSPKDDDWKLLKKKTEYEIEKANKTVGTYIYDTLLRYPAQKIKGKLVRTIERKFYKEELSLILAKQTELNNALQNKDLYLSCIEELYPNNANHRNTLEQRSFSHLFIEDIIFHQRALRSQKNTISTCPLETRYYFADGVRQSEPIKCIPKSHPAYQEFRLWQWISNLRLINKETDAIETDRYLPDATAIADLFAFLTARRDVDQKAILKFFKVKENKYRWNYVEDKKYPCNETRTLIASRLEKMGGVPEDFLTKEREEALWHILYSVTDKIDYQKALKTFARKNDLSIEVFFEAFRKFPPFESEYGAYSAKAIKKLLPLMRTGEYWSESQIDTKTMTRIDKIITGEYDETIRDTVRDKAINLTTVARFQGLPEWLAKYVAYDRHSERADAGKWETAADLEAYLANFRQHSLRNPIVEKLLAETLRTVRDIWKHYGNGRANFFDEIHIELGREMKNPADKRKELTEQITRNENTNLRIKALLAELSNDLEVANVRPYSPMQQDILKIFEEGVLNSGIEIPIEIEKISKQAQPSDADLRRYKLWLEQKYRSPYTGKIIPLNKLFTPAFEIEHIIPQQRFFDDSMSNKVICESAVNKLKDNMTGLEFIQHNHGQVVELGKGETATIFSEADYVEFVKQHYEKNRGKKNKLLALDVPEKMIERQLNDTRYISKFVMQLLSNIVRTETNDDGVNAKNILATNGQITSKLKQDWGFDALWNDLILHRFERLNAITNTDHFTTYNERHQKYLPTVPLALQKGFQKKRIDHRHHALDALVIACATRNHINYLNNQNALDKRKTRAEKDKDRNDLKLLLCDKKYNDGENYNWVLKQPWPTLVPDAKLHLQQVIVSFKQNVRVLNKTVNRYQKIIDGTKQEVKQTKGENWAIRKPLHKDTVAGIIRLRSKKTVTLSAAVDNWEMLVNRKLRAEIRRMQQLGKNKKTILQHFKDFNNKWNDIDVSKVEVYYWEEEMVASRVNLDSSFNEAAIKSITDSGIQKILLRHLGEKENNPEIAFSPEGIEEMNKNMVALNAGKNHQPILKVRTYEPKGNKFSVGETGNKRHKYVEAAKGTNLFFAIYRNESGKRAYATIPLNIIIERQKQNLSAVPELNDAGGNLLFHLSPNDLVYVPSREEMEQTSTIGLSSFTPERTDRIYKVVSATGNQCFFVRHDIAKAIVDKFEFSPLNKTEKSIDGVMIKEHCRKLNVNRLGQIILMQ